MKHALTTVSAAALAACIGSGVALAQSSNTGGDQAKSDQQNMQNQQAGGSQNGGKSASDLTCAEVTGLDTARIPGVLYYISGFDAGSNGGQSATQGQASADAGSSTGDAAKMPSADSAQTNASAQGSSAGAGGGSGDASAMQPSDTASATGDTTKMQANSGSSGGGSSDASAMQTSDAGSNGAAGATNMQANNGGGANGNGQSGNGQVQVVRVAGFYEIPIEKTMIACADAPQKRAGDVVREQQQQNPDAQNSGN